MHDSQYTDWDAIHAQEREKLGQRLSHAAAVFGILLIVYSLAYGWMGFSFIVSSALSLLITLILINRVDVIAHTSRQAFYGQAGFALLFAAQMTLSTLAFVDATKG